MTKKMTLWEVVKILPTDYSDYGGAVQRWQDTNLTYPDCSSGCRYYRRLHTDWESVEDADWGVCINPESPRAGLLTFEHQAGEGCWEHERF